MNTTCKIKMTENDVDELRIKLGLRNNRLIHERLKRNLSQLTAATAIGIAPSNLTSYETFRKMPQAFMKDRIIWNTTAKKIAKFYNRELNYLWPEWIQYIYRSQLEFTANRENIQETIKKLPEYSLPRQMPSPEEHFQRLEAAREIGVAMDRLVCRQKEVVEMHVVHQMTFREIGKELGVTRERARQIFNNAMMRLRSPMRSEMLKEFKE